MDSEKKPTRRITCKMCGRKFVGKRGLKVHLSVVTKQEKSILTYRQKYNKPYSPEEVAHIKTPHKTTIGIDCL